MACAHGRSTRGLAFQTVTSRGYTKHFMFCDGGTLLARMWQWGVEALSPPQVRGKAVALTSLTHNAVFYQPSCREWKGGEAEKFEIVAKRLKREPHLTDPPNGATQAGRRLVWRGSGASSKSAQHFPTCHGVMPSDL